MNTSYLPEYLLYGPPLSRDGSPWACLWTVCLYAPEFVDGEIQVDRTHPVRTILLDITSSGEDDDHNRVLSPRLVSAHLMRRPTETLTGNFVKKGQSFSVRLVGSGQPKDNQIPVTGFHTASNVDGYTDGFHHIVGRPVVGGQLWPMHDEEEAYITMPACRLEQGTIQMRLTTDKMSWLTANTKIVLTANTVNLVADGIIITATVPFLDASVDGVFLLAPVDDGKFSLTLMPDRLSDEQRKTWLAKWSGLIDAQQTGTLSGFRVEINRGVVPAFVWNFPGTATGLGAAVGPILVPGPDINVRLIGPVTDVTPDGDVDLNPLFWTLSLASDASPLTNLAAQSTAIWGAGTDWGNIANITAWLDRPVDHVVLLSATILPSLAGKSRTNPQNIMEIVSTAEIGAVPAQHAITLTGKGQTLVYDEVQLAQTLRSAQGLTDPPLGQPVSDPPLLWAFVPLDDGWLQMPTPNMAGLDPTKDTSFLTAVAAQPPNVISGFLRYGEAENFPAVLSATGTGNKLSVQTAPWLVTMEGAQGIALAIGLQKGAPIAGKATLLGPEISTRGLLWLSSDRPDEFEALPRLGAGPGQFLDLPLQTQTTEDDSFLAINLSQLAFTVTKSPAGPDVVSRTALQLAVGFDAEATSWDKPALATNAKVMDWYQALTGHAPPVPLFPSILWRRHGVMPLASLMPMTRAASSAIPPLESRDLVPFVYLPNDKEKMLLTWDMAVASSTVFPKVTKDDETVLLVAPAGGWPWAAAFPTGINYGIGLAAFGAPGAEMTFPQKPDLQTNSGWNIAIPALRYDLPCLDEAFATATLPPVPPVKDADTTGSPPPPPPTAKATALDLSLLKLFWDFQEQRHRLSRVMHSHLLPYPPSPLPAEVPPRVPIALVGGMSWDKSVGFTPGVNTDPLPYGTITIDGKSLTGNEALKGMTRTGADALKLKKAGSVDEISVEFTGFSPHTIELDKAQIDSRGTGFKEMDATDASLLKRPFSYYDGTAFQTAELRTLKKPISINLPSNKGALQFWFKDMPFRGDKLVLPPPATTNPTNPWQDGQLPLLGGEWRLWMTHPDEAKKAFAFGRDLIPFFGFALEPLQLTSFARDEHGTMIVAILCRLHLGPREKTPYLGNGVTLKLAVDLVTQTAEIVAVDMGAPAFTFSAIETAAADAPARQIQFAPTLTWDKAGGLACTNADLKVAMFGRDVEFSQVTVTFPPDLSGGVTINCPGSTPPATLSPGQAKFGLRSITLNIFTQTDALHRQPTLAFQRWIALLPTSDAGEAATNFKPALVANFGALGNKVTIFGTDLTPAANYAFNEHAGAISVTLNQQSFPVAIRAIGTGTVSFGLVANLDFDKWDPATGTTALTAGYLDGRFSVDDKLGQGILAKAACRQRKGGSANWTGSLTLALPVTLTNAIKWPDVQLPQAPGVWADELPLRVVGKKNSRQQVDFKANDKRTHTVVYHLDGHQMAYSLAWRLMDSTATPPAIYSVAVQAQHTISDPAQKQPLTFVSIETVVLGRLSHLAPPITRADANRPDDLMLDKRTFSDDPVSFAARYRDMVKSNGEVDQTTRVPGMDGFNSGIGRLATMVQGIFGLPLRASDPPLPDELVIIGGFAGLVAWQKPGAPAELSASLTRLPVLAFPLSDPAKGPSLPQAETQVDMNWADMAPLPVRMNLRTARTLASGSYANIRDALASTLEPAKADPGDIFLAVVVEQSFRYYMDNPTSAKLGSTVFFPASAVSVSNLLQAYFAASPGSLPTVVSLLAGSYTKKDTDKANIVAEFSSSLLTAQSVKKDDPQNKKATRPLASRLATLGADVVVGDWTAGAAPANPATPDPAKPNTDDDVLQVPRLPILARATVEHPQPIVALVVQVASDKTTYTAIDTGTPRRRLTCRPPAADAYFAEAQRGFAFAPGDASTAWLEGLEEGVTKPIRNDGANSTGIAGLARRLDLPRQGNGELPPKPATDAANPPPQAPIYFSETRAPIYQPEAALQNLKAPPAGWLSPSSTRPRLPSGETLTKAMTGLFSGLTDPPASQQWIVPAGAEIVSVADRAGISMARIDRLETNLDIGEPFDASFPQFGNPGQGSAWSMRTERTPRPGPLPPNKGTALFPAKPQTDRRTFASLLEFDRAADLIRGPVEIISGELKQNDNVFPWVARFVVGSDWDGMFTDSWDGTIAVDVEIDLGFLQAVADLCRLPVLNDPRHLLYRILMPPVNYADSAPTLKSSAALAIGDVVIPYTNIAFDTSDVGMRPMTTAGGTTDPLIFMRGVVRFILSTTDLSMSLRIKAALQNLTNLPPCEIRLTVFPEDNNPAATPVNSGTPIKLSDASLNTLPCGGTRPPVTLRMPLSPVVRTRGALPLPRHTLIFSDPAYDDALGSQPASKRNRVTVANATLPTNRGDLLGSLYIDRAKVNVQGSILLMADLGFERPMTTSQQAIADGNGCDGGDFVQPGPANSLKLEFARNREGTEPTPLYLYVPPGKVGDPLKKDICAIQFAQVYEIALDRLRDDKGAAILAPGDALQVTWSDSPSPNFGKYPLWNSDTNRATDATISSDTPFSCMLFLEITADPVAEPPPSLYAALLLRETDKATKRALSLPLYAQSPYPWRIVPRNAKADFRAGYVRRSAFFIWRLSRPSKEWQLPADAVPVSTSVYLAKSERNGQTYLPESRTSDFINLRTISPASAAPTAAAVAPIPVAPPH